MRKHYKSVDSALYQRGAEIMERETGNSVSMHERSALYNAITAAFDLATQGDRRVRLDLSWIRNTDNHVSMRAGLIGGGTHAFFLRQALEDVVQRGRQELDPSTGGQVIVLLEEGDLRGRTSERTERERSPELAYSK